MSEVIITTVNANIELVLKIFILSLLLVFALFMRWNCKNIDPQTSQYNLVLYLISRYMSMVYIFASPFTFLLLNHTISFEFFVWFLASMYLAFGVLGFLLLGLFTKDKVLSYITRDNKIKRQERKKYGV